MDRDEPSLRRPDFAGGVPIMLSDGRAWTFPRPEMSDLYFRPGPDGKPALAAGLTFGPEYEELVEEYLAADDGAAELKALAALAMDLLSRNYALGPADFRALLRVRRAGDPGEAENRAMWEAIADVALGRGPKPMPIG